MWRLRSSPWNELESFRMYFGVEAIGLADGCGEEMKDVPVETVGTILDREESEMPPRHPGRQSSKGGMA